MPTDDSCYWVLDFFSLLTPSSRSCNNLLRWIERFNKLHLDIYVLYVMVITVDLDPRLDPPQSFGHAQSS
jgi:hypothetical protein